MSKLMLGTVIRVADNSQEAILNAKKAAANALAEAILKESETYEDIFIIKELDSGMSVGTKILFPHVETSEEDSLKILKTVMEGAKE